MNFTFNVYKPENTGIEHFHACGNGPSSTLGVIKDHEVILDVELLPNPEESSVTDLRDSNISHALVFWDIYETSANGYPLLDLENIQDLAVPTTYGEGRHVDVIPGEKNIYHYKARVKFNFLSSRLQHKAGKTKTGFMFFWPSKMEPSKYQYVIIGPILVYSRENIMKRNLLCDAGMAPPVARKRKRYHHTTDSSSMVEQQSIPSERREHMMSPYITDEEMKIIDVPPTDTLRWKKTYARQQTILQLIRDMQEKMDTTTTTTTTDDSTTNSSTMPPFQILPAMAPSEHTFLLNDGVDIDLETMETVRTGLFDRKTALQPFEFGKDDDTVLIQQAYQKWNELHSIVDRMSKQNQHIFSQSKLDIMNRWCKIQ